MRRRREELSLMVRAWFALTPAERAILTGILAATLLGLTARYFHLKSRDAIVVPAPDAVDVEQRIELQDR